MMGCTVCGSLKIPLNEVDASPCSHAWQRRAVYLSCLPTSCLVYCFAGMTEAQLVEELTKVRAGRLRVSISS